MSYSPWTLTSTTDIYNLNIICMRFGRWMCEHMRMHVLAHSPSCWETSTALIAAAGTGWLGKHAGPLLCSGPKEELRESSFVSSSSTYLTCLHAGKESLCCSIFTSAVFVCSLSFFRVTLSPSSLALLACPISDVWVTLKGRGEPLYNYKRTQLRSCFKTGSNLIWMALQATKRLSFMLLCGAWRCTWSTVWRPQTETPVK